MKENMYSLHTLFVARGLSILVLGNLQIFLLYSWAIILNDILDGGNGKLKYFKSLSLLCRHQLAFLDRFLDT